MTSEEILKKWLNGEYVSPNDFKKSVKNVVKRVEILEKIYKSDVEYFMKENKRLMEQVSILESAYDDLNNSRG